MDERNDETIDKEDLDTEQPLEPWHQRHFLPLLAGGMLLLVVFVIVVQMFFPD